MRTILTFLTAFLLAFTVRSQTSIVVRTAATMHNPTNYTLVTPTSVQFFTSNGITSFSLTLTSNANATDWRADLGISDWVTNPAAPSYSLTEIGVTPFNTNLLLTLTDDGGWRTAIGVAEWTTNAGSPLFNATAYSSNLTLLSDAASWQGALSIEPNASAVVDTVADLDDTEVAAGKAVFVRGYHAAGDGGGGWFYASNTETNVDGVGLCFESATAGWAWNRVRQSDQFVNVKWFGAKGDGVTYDNYAISNAVAAGNTIYFPSGTYLCNTNWYGIKDGDYASGKWNCVVKLRSNMTIYGDGMYKSQLVLTNIPQDWPGLGGSGTNMHLMMFYTTVPTVHLTNFALRDIGLKQDWPVRPVHRYHTLLRLNSWGGGYWYDVQIERVLFSKSCGFAIGCFSSVAGSPVNAYNSSRVVDCVFNDISDCGINIPFGPIERCYFRSVGQVVEGAVTIFRDNYTDYCSQFNVNSDAIPDSSEAAYYGVIENNVFMRCRSGGSIFAQIPSRAYHIKNNYFYDVDGLALAITEPTGYPGTPTPSRKAVIQGNTFVNCGTYYTQTNGGYGYKLALNLAASDCVVMNNYFGNTDSHTKYGWTTVGIHIANPTTGTATNNIITGNVFGEGVYRYWVNYGNGNADSPQYVDPSLCNRAGFRLNDMAVNSTLTSNYFALSDYISVGPYLDSPLIKAQVYPYPSNYYAGVTSKLNVYPGSMYIDMKGGTNNTLWINQHTNFGNMSSNGWNAVLTDAPMWIDSMVPAASMRLPSSGYPGLDTFTNGIQCLKFDDASDESVHFAVQINHNAVMPTNTLKPHVHWTTSEVQTAPNTNIVWGLEYTIANISAEFVASSTIYLTNGPVELNKLAHTMTSFADIPVTAMTPSMVIMCRLFRDADNGADTLTGDANLIGFDFHYQVDSLGSETP